MPTPLILQAVNSRSHGIREVLLSGPFIGVGSVRGYDTVRNKRDPGRIYRGLNDFDDVFVGAVTGCHTNTSARLSGGFARCKRSLEVRINYVRHKENFHVTIYLTIVLKTDVLLSEAAIRLERVPVKP